MDIKRNFDDRRGVRTEEGYFSSDQLIQALRFHDPENLRSDCEDPTILRVRIGGVWIKAFHKRVQSLALASPEQKLFDLLYAPVRRSHARERKEAIAKCRHDRIQLANFATAGDQVDRLCVEHAITHIEQQNKSADEGKDDSKRALWDDLDLYEEKGSSK